MKDLELWQRVFARIEDQRHSADHKRLEEIREHWRQFGEIRDKELLIRIGYSSNEFVDKCLSEHPARKLWKDVANVKRAFHILRTSRLALIELSGAFHARIEHWLLDEESQEEALSEATKEIYTYSCASASLIQAYRHLVSDNETIRSSYESLRKEILGDSPIIEFFSQLRRANNHLHILTAFPHYSISKNLERDTTTVTTGIGFNKNLIERDASWSARARSFAASQKDLDVIRLVEEHFSLAHGLFKLVFVRTGIQADPSFRDYERILFSRDTIGQRASLGIILQQAVSGKLNPYEYLDRWFTDAELRRIYSLPDHTKAQLEYMISLRDPLGLCDGHTRQQLYELFSVPVDELPEHTQEGPLVDF